MILSQNKNAQPKKITRNLLDEDLQKHLVNTENTRLKTEKINMDDLSSDIVTKINSWGAPAGSSYNDSELRKRIAAIESNQVKKNLVFNIERNKVDENLLDNTLADLIKQIPTLVTKVDSLESNKADKANSFVRQEKIQIHDLSDDLRKKIDYSFAYYQAAIPSGEIGEVTNIADLSAAITKLNEAKANKADLNLYRKIDTKISAEDMDAYCIKAIQNAANLATQLDSKAGKSDLANYRKLSEKIGQHDLSPDIGNIIQRSGEIIADVNNAIETAVSVKFDNIRNKFSTEELGQRYFFMDELVVINPVDNSVTGDNIGMPYRRQVVKAAGKDAVNHPLHDTYTMIDIMNWIIKYVTGIQYDTAILDAATQKEICDYAATKTPQFSRHRSFNGNKSYYGVTENGFTLTESISYIISKITEMKNSSLTSSELSDVRRKLKDIKDIKDDIKSIKERLLTIEEKIKTIP